MYLRFSTLEIDWKVGQSENGPFSFDFGRQDKLLPVERLFVGSISVIHCRGPEMLQRMMKCDRSFVNLRQSTRREPHRRSVEVERGWVCDARLGWKEGKERREVEEF